MISVGVIHGPNLNLMGVRDPEVYGNHSLAQIDQEIEQRARELEIEVRVQQFNHEGDIVDAIQDAREWADALIINPAGFTTYSIAIRDAIQAVRLPTVEVHLSNMHGREPFRSNSVISPVVFGQIEGFGVDSYLLALQAVKNIVLKRWR